LTDEQKQQIKDLWRAEIPMKQIKRQNFPEFSITTLYKQLPFKRNYIHHWTQEQDETLVKLRAKGMTAAKIRAKAFPSRSNARIIARLMYLPHTDPDIHIDLRKPKPVPITKRIRVLNLYHKGTQDLEIAKMLKLDHASVKEYIRGLRTPGTEPSEPLRPPRPSREQWTAAEDDLLRPDLAVRFSAQHFATLSQTPGWQRTFESTYQRIRQLCLKEGITLDWRKWTSEEESSAIELSADGLTASQIAKKIGRNRFQVLGFLRRMESSAT